MCHRLVAMEQFNLCPVCGCNDSTVAAGSPLAIRVGEARVLSDNTRVLGAQLTADIAQAMADAINARYYVKTEQVETVMQPPCRRVGFEASTTALIFGGVLKEDHDIGMMAQEVGLADDDEARANEIAIAIAAT